MRKMAERCHRVYRGRKLCGGEGLPEHNSKARRRPAGAQGQHHLQGVRRQRHGRAGQGPGRGGAWPAARPFRSHRAGRIRPSPTPWPYGPAPGRARQASNRLNPPVPDPVAVRAVAPVTAAKLECPAAAGTQAGGRPIDGAARTCRNRQAPKPAPTGGRRGARQAQDRKPCKPASRGAPNRRQPWTGPAARLRRNTLGQICHVLGHNALRIAMRGQVHAKRQRRHVPALEPVANGHPIRKRHIASARRMIEHLGYTGRQIRTRP